MDIYIQEALKELKSFNLDESLLLEMAFERGVVVGKIQSLIEPIGEHLVKCVVYKNTTQNLYHWVNELAEYFRVINELQVKKLGKLKEKEYLNYLTQYFGENITDCLSILDIFKLSNKNKYPGFETNEELATNLFSVYTNLFNEVSKIFAIKKNNYSKKDFNMLIFEILNKNSISL